MDALSEAKLQYINFYSLKLIMNILSAVYKLWPTTEYTIKYQIENTEVLCFSLLFKILKCLENKRNNSHVHSMSLTADLLSIGIYCTFDSNFTKIMDILFIFLT